MSKGFTLIEAITGLALFMILSIGVIFLWQHTSRNARSAIEIQNTLDHLGTAMEALIINIELSRSIILYTDNQDILRRLYLYGNNPQGARHTFLFEFNQHAQHSTPRYKSLFFGGQQHSYGIETVSILNIAGRRLDITISSVCKCPVTCAGISKCKSSITISGSANIQHKHITVR